MTGSDLDRLLNEFADRVARRLAELQPSRQAAEGTSPWMSAATAADYLDWPKQRVYKLSASGDIPHVKHAGRLLFNRGDLDTWLRQHSPHGGLRTG
jgi:excisionase family DNA binding protein